MMCISDEEIEEAASKLSDEYVINEVNDFRNFCENIQNNSSVFKWITVDYSFDTKEKSTKTEAFIDPCYKKRTIQKIAFFKKMEQLIKEGKLS